MSFRTYAATAAPAITTPRMTHNNGDTRRFVGAALGFDTVGRGVTGAGFGDVEADD